MNKIEKIIGNAVKRNFPAAADMFLYNPVLLSQFPIDHNDEAMDTRDLKDGSGREYFMWGISRWGDGDIVAE